MRPNRADSMRFLAPELEVAELISSYSPRRSIEDSNDLGELGDCFSIGTDLMSPDDDYVA
jgi:hypothetical protein